MLKFNYKAIVEYTKRELILEEITFSDYKTLVKILVNNDDNLINNSFEKILNKIVAQKDLNLIEKVICLLTARSVSMSDIIELSSECPIAKKEFNITINLNNILKNFQEFLIKNKDSFEKELTYNENFTIQLGLPSSLYFERSENNLYQFIKKISLNGVDYFNLSENELEKLPYNILTDIKNFIINLENTCSSFTFIDLISPFTTLSNSKINFSIISNSFFELLKIIFKRSLIELYELEVILASRINLPESIIQNSTLAENMVYFNVFKRFSEESAKSTPNTQLNPPVM